MSVNLDDLKRFVEEKIAQCKKELEIYEYFLSLIETGELKPTGKVSKGLNEVVKSPKGEVVADIYYYPPKVKIILRKRTKVPKQVMNVIERILATEKNDDKIDYSLSADEDVLKEITIDNVNNDIVYVKISSALKPVLERL
ncbi:MAG: hypothetical protein RQ863_04805 [Sulfolobales archaeon]|jgi:hypothetical protein|nr:hypothetical protein [Sulfolobales archaeon]